MSEFYCVGLRKQAVKFQSNFEQNIRILLLKYEGIVLRIVKFGLYLGHAMSNINK